MSGIMLILLILTGCNAETISVSTETGRDIQMTCKYNTELGQGYNYVWHIIYTSTYFIIQDGDKYSGTITETLTIKNTDGSDTGDYVCGYYKDKPNKMTVGTSYKLTVNVDGNWSDWSGWNKCSASCGDGTKYRNRSCSNPPRSVGGKDCEGGGTDSRPCITQRCSDIPFIEPSETTVEVISGNNVSLPCIYDAYPDATEMYWKKDGVKLFEDFIKYIGSSLSRPNLTILKSEIDDSGIYSCVIRNSIGTGFSGNIHLIIIEPYSQLYIGIVAGIIVAVIVVVVVCVGLVAMFFVKRKKQTKNSGHIYTMRDMNQVEEHSYMQNQDNAQNYAEAVCQEPSVQSQDVITAYDLGDFSKILSDVHLCNKKIQDEFQWLTNNRPEYETASLTDYDDVETRYDGFVNTAIVKKDGNELISIITKPPSEFTIDIFWQMVEDKKISDVIWLTQKGEKLMDILPTIEDPIDVSGLQIKLVSSLRKDNGIVIHSVQLINKKKKTVQSIQFYKTTKWKATQRFPDVELLKDLIIIPVLKKGGIVIMGSKGFCLRTCGILRVCLEVVQASTENGTFNILEIAMRLNKPYPEFFQTVEEYELCYQVLRKYVENEHHYYYIE